MIALSQSLLDSGRMGLITLGADRNVRSCLGSLVSWLPTGSQVSDIAPMLIGLDDVLDDIDEGRRSSFILPRISVDDGLLTGKVVSLEITPSTTSGQLQILLRDETEIAALEQKVLQQRNELMLANEALAEAKRRAELALREKSSFLANVSHDLKTPLQVIMGNAEILRGDLSEAERDAYLQDTLDNSDFLLSLITDLLDASALEAGQLKLQEEAVDIDALLRKIVSTARRLPEGSRRRFDLSLQDIGCTILADPMRLQRLLLNLVCNAVRFAGDGGVITVKTGLAGTGDFTIDIEDDGCGIEPDMMERVFEPFTTSSTAEGTGLGLHIAKGLADLHGAGLVLTSKPGIGTRARLRLPGRRILEAPA